jgi:hypothetical protein
MYFNEFPTIPYNFNIGGKNTLRVVKDITLNVRLKKALLDSLTQYNEYNIVDGDTPERIAEQAYGNANYHWIVMLCNERYDYSTDFPMTNEQLFAYVNKKYGQGNSIQQHQIFGTPHYETADRQIVDADYPNAIPVTNYDYEFRLNEQKRKIKLVSPNIIGQIANELKDLL